HGREQALCGAYLAAASFASAGAGLHHKICHVLGGTFNLPHADVHTVVLPYVTAFNVAAAPEAGRRIATALGGPDALAGLTTLYEALDAPRALRDLGFNEDQIPAAAQIILPTVPASNPRRVGTADLERLLHAACAGTSPAQSGARASDKKLPATTSTGRTMPSRHHAGPSKKEKQTRLPLLNHLAMLRQENNLDAFPRGGPPSPPGAG
ncbi:MAG: iron-containing alcohol dehydrogenase, partial [Arthrobacter sp.]